MFYIGSLNIEFNCKILNGNFLIKNLNSKFNLIGSDELVLNNYVIDCDVSQDNFLYKVFCVWPVLWVDK